MGFAKKDGIEKPFFAYEKELYKALMIPGYLNSNPKSSSPLHSHPPLHSADSNPNNNNSNNILYPFKEKHLWVIKATGLGISTFMLRFMAWLCLYDDDYKDSQMVIVTGPNIDLAIKLIRRMKAMFVEKLGVTFDTKETVLELNGCEHTGLSFNHIDSFRSLDNPKFLMLDELDFIPKFQQEDVRAVAERYIAKSNPYIVMVSTPNAPGGLFDTIQKEPLETCLYKKFFLDYLWGIDKIYSEEEIANAKLSPSFPREYQLQYQGLIGNVFSTQSIENATKIQYNPDNINPSAKKSIALTRVWDPITLPLLQPNL